MLFNKKIFGSKKTETLEKGQVLNHERALAFKTTKEYELYSAVVTTSLGDKFYEDGGSRIKRIRELLPEVSPYFVAKLAVYAREKMYLRSVPLVLAIELSRLHKGDHLLQKLVERIVQRADEITELLAYYQAANNRKGVKKLNALSKQVQKGLGRAFNKFDEYQFAKYNRDAEIKLRDALFLVHPKPKDEAQQALFNKIAANELAVPYTWEVELSVLGQQKFENEELKRTAVQIKWEELIDSGRVGYMALLRNLRNILQAGVSTVHIKKVCATLSDEKQVRNSKQFPFRFLSAYRELKAVQLKNANLVLEALEAACKASAANIQGFDEKTSVVLACDVSGSMQKAVSPKSTVQCYDIGLILAMLLQSRCDSVITGFFGDTWKQLSMPRNQILSNCEEMRKREGEVGYSTNGHLVVRDLIQRKIVADKVMLFTDCQMWDSNATGDSLAKAWKEYKERVAPNARVYIFDLAGYGREPLKFGEADSTFIAGWSDKVFEMLEALEKGGTAIEEIMKIEL